MKKGNKVVPEGATVGTGTGAVIGGALGWLAGIGAIALAPALGIFVAAGPIMTGLTRQKRFLKLQAHTISQ